jgi:hypothetical protein
MATAAPGVRREDVLPAVLRALRTGVPAFFGLADRVGTPGPDGAVGVVGAVGLVQPVQGWADVLAGRPLLAGRGWQARPDSRAEGAVRAFLANGGALCYLVWTDAAAPPAAGAAAGVVAGVPLVWARTRADPATTMHAIATIAAHRSRARTRRRGWEAVRDWE